MLLDSQILGLPTSILLLIASYPIFSTAHEAQSLAQKSKDSYYARQDVDAVRELSRLGRSPVGVKKMSEDEGEKFYMDYWQFDASVEQSQLILLSSPRRRHEEEDDVLLANLTASVSYRPPFALHTQGDSDYQDVQGREADARSVLTLLEKRGFVCPTGTASCSGIGYPNSCCSTDETCFAIQDTGLGPVGCCPNGSTCGGTISECNFPNTACTENLSGAFTGGGCCIPDYVCAGVGCVLNSSSSTPVVSSTTTTSTTSTTSSSTTQTTSPTSSTPSTTATSSTATAVPPVRPTSESTITSTDTSVTATATTCPTGFYACVAYYAGGCCRTGRNCDTTSCPAISSITLISSGPTIVVPAVGAATTTADPTGNCASGWSTCAATLGGNCCPSGYQCGTASCSSVQPTATSVSPKEKSSSGSSSVGVSGLCYYVVTLLIVAFCTIEL